MTSNHALKRDGAKARRPLALRWRGSQISASEPAEQSPSLFHGSGAGGIGCRWWTWGVIRKWVPGAIGRRGFIESVTAGGCL